MPNVYQWDNFAIGETRAYANCFRQAVITSFKTWVRARHLDWDCSTRSDPKSPKAGQRCNMVWLTRIEPRNRDERLGVELGADPVSSIDERALQLRTGMDLKAPALRTHMHGINLRPVYLDFRDLPIQVRLDAYEAYHDRTRLTKYGWERMAVGDFEIRSMRRADILSQIRGACLKRGLDWRWEIRRVQNPEDPNDRLTCYLVTRLR